MKTLIISALLAALSCAVPVRGDGANSDRWAIEERRSNETDKPLNGEDPSCEFVNRALQRTYNSGRYSEQLYEVWPDGTAKLALEWRFAGRFTYQIDGFSGWSILRREGRYTVGVAGAVFSNCRGQTNGSYLGAPVTFIDAKWHRENRTAEATVVVADGKLLRLDRHFTSATPFRTDRVYSLFETDRDKIQKPDTKPEIPW